MAQSNMLQDLLSHSLACPCPRKPSKMLRIRRQLHLTICGSSTWSGNDTTRRHHSAKCGVKWSDNCSVSKDDCRGDVTCPTSNIAAGVGYCTIHYSWGRGLKYQRSGGVGLKIITLQQLGDVVENSGLEWGTWLNIVFDLVDVKHQTKHPDDGLRKIRSDQAKITRRLTAKIGEYFNRGKEVL